MRYQGDSIENLTNAAESNDFALIREIVLDKISQLIENNPQEIINALKHSNVQVSESATKEDLINKASSNIVNNKLFQKNIAVIMVFENTGESPKEEDYANGEGGAGTGSGGSGGGGWITSVADMVGSGFKFGIATQELKATQATAKASMFEKVFGKEQKTNWLPIIAIAGVLLIGGLVVWRVTASKN